MGHRLSAALPAALLFAALLATAGRSAAQPNAATRMKSRRR
jgi:hypothetical protein